MEFNLGKGTYGIDEEEAEDSISVDVNEEAKGKILDMIKEEREDSVLEEINIENIENLELSIEKEVISEDEMGEVEEEEVQETKEAQEELHEEAYEEVEEEIKDNEEPETEEYYEIGIDNITIEIKEDDNCEEKKAPKDRGIFEFLDELIHIYRNR